MWIISRFGTVSVRWSYSRGWLILTSSSRVMEDIQPKWHMRVFLLARFLLNLMRRFDVLGPFLNINVSVVGGAQQILDGRQAGL